MFKSTSVKLVLIIFLLFSFASKSNAIDKIKMLKPLLGFDKRAKHKDEVIIRSLEVTVDEYGPFTFEAVDVDMTPSRALASMKTGSLINIFIAPSSEVWNVSTIPIKIPIRQGLLSYRLLLVNKINLAKFEKVKDFDDLKHLRAGLQNDWITTNIFKKLEMNVVTAHTFEGLFLMLNKHRSDYIPRAIYEIYDELNTRKGKLNNVVVEPTIALHLPMFSFVYVSPKEQKIASRIKSGLLKLKETGELNDIFDKYYAKDIIKADLKNRRVIEIKNPFITDMEVVEYKDLLL